MRGTDSIAILTICALMLAETRATSCAINPAADDGAYFYTSTSSTVNIDLTQVTPPVNTPAGADAYLDTTSCLGYLGPIGPYGPLGSLGPLGNSSWSPQYWISGAFDWSQFQQNITGTTLCLLCFPEATPNSTPITYVIIVGMGGPLSSLGPLGPSGPMSDYAFFYTMGCINDFAHQMAAKGVWPPRRARSAGPHRRTRLPGRQARQLPRLERPGRAHLHRALQQLLLAHLRALRVLHSGVCAHIQGAGHVLHGARRARSEQLHELYLPTRLAPEPGGHHPACAYVPIRQLPAHALARQHATRANLRTHLHRVDSVPRKGRRYLLRHHRPAVLGAASSQRVFPLRRRIDQRVPVQRHWRAAGAEFVTKV